ncbi:MAG: hypothetical protein AB1816_00495 [Bacillota bacterium]
MTFACVFASPAVGCAGGGDASRDRGAHGLLPRAARAVARLDLPWRRRLARVTDAEGEGGWVAILPADAPAERVKRTLRQLTRRGAGAISVSPQLGVSGPGLHLWMAACLRAALLLATAAAGRPRHALVVGADTPAGRLALAWLAARVRYISVGDTPGPGRALLADRLLADLGVTVQWEPVEVPGRPWKGDLVVWADGKRAPGREISAPVWLRCGRGQGQPQGTNRSRPRASQVVPERGAGWAERPAGAALVLDALIAGVGLEGVPPWWWREWGWPPGFLPAGGLEAALVRCHLASPGRAREGWRGPARVLDEVWRLAVERGWALAGAVLAPESASRVAWLTGMGGPHIIWDAVG